MKTMAKALLTRSIKGHLSSKIKVSQQNQHNIPQNDQNKQKQIFNQVNNQAMKGDQLMHQDQQVQQDEHITSQANKQEHSVDQQAQMAGTADMGGILGTTIAKKIEITDLQQLLATFQTENRDPNNFRNIYNRASISNNSS